MADESRKHWHHHRRTPWLMGPIWIMGWLFTIGYVGSLVWWQIILAIVIWPYHLGRVVGG
jgi:hypothetical protein